MKKLEHELLISYLEQSTLRTQNAVSELQLLQKQLNELITYFSKYGMPEKTTKPIADLALTIERPQNNDKQPNDLIRIKEVMQMTSLSRSSIYVKRNSGDFPSPIQLSSRTVAWVRSDVERWIADRIHNINQ